MFDCFKILLIVCNVFVIVSLHTLAHLHLAVLGRLFPAAQREIVIELDLCSVPLRLIDLGHLVSRSIHPDVRVIE